MIRKLMPGALLILSAHSTGCVKKAKQEGLQPPMVKTCVAEGEGSDKLMPRGSVAPQVVHLHTNLKLILLVRGEPDCPRDLKAVAHHITEFSLRGLAVPEAFQGA